MAPARRRTRSHVVWPARSIALSFLTIITAALLAPGAAAQPTCVVPDNGSGTVNLPPPGCGYVSPTDLHHMIAGLPPGTTINVAAEHDRFFNVVRQPGGSLGGEKENFLSNLTLQLTGTGALSGFNRTAAMQIACEVHTGPRTPGAAVQTFGNQMHALQGQLPSGDPDFDLLRITAGASFGMPSPGQTTLTRLPSGDFNVDSFFDISYEIEYIGNPSGPLGGLSGTTTGTLRMQGGQPAPSPPACVVAPNAMGTVDLPPLGCPYLSPSDVHKIINGLPPGTVINLGAEHSRFANIVRTPGGSLGGEIETFNSALILDMQGTGALSGLARTLFVPATTEVHTAPRTPGASVQSFATDMFRLQGQLPTGDPDFDLLRVRAGTAFGLPSPGHTTLTRLPSGDFNVDSFFDIDYQIDFVGKPGGALGGMSGTTTGSIHMRGGTPFVGLPPCVVPDMGTGTVSLPPPGCGYVSPDDLHRMINGLPAGTTIEVGAQHMRFFNVVQTPGGTLGGEIEQFSSTLMLNMEGTGALSHFHRTIPMQVQTEVHSGPRTPGTNVQSFPTDMFLLDGTLPSGDPDFALFEIRGGTGNGLPSPGHTTLTRQPDNTWHVDSFFDIDYQIDFVGAPGGALGGMSGTTGGTIRMVAVDEVTAPPGTPHLQVSKGAPGFIDFAWNAVATASAYDVVQGTLASLQASSGDYGVSTTACLANNTASTSLTIGSSGIDGLWVVVRGVNIGGPGTYNSLGPQQVGLRDAEIASSGNACP